MAVFYVQFALISPFIYGFYSKAQNIVQIIMQNQVFASNQLIIDSQE